MSHIVVDIEADGPIPGLYSMVCFGAVIVEDGLTKTFYGKTKPVSDKWNPEALSISGFSREEHLTFDDPEKVMLEFSNWIKDNSKGRSIFWSDNLAFDWMWICYYLHKYTGENPFGFSGRRIGDVWSGMMMNSRSSSEWKKFRKSNHDHNPVNDAKGNAEALLEIKKRGFKIDL